MPEVKLRQRHGIGNVALQEDCRERHVRPCRFGRGCRNVHLLSKRVFGRRGASCPSFKLPLSWIKPELLCTRVCRQP